MYITLFGYSMLKSSPAVLILKVKNYFHLAMKIPVVRTVSISVYVLSILDL